MNNKIYDVMKWIALIALPAAAGLISTLGQICGWVDADKVTLAVNAVAFFIGSLIGVSTYQYNRVTKDDE